MATSRKALNRDDTRRRVVTLDEADEDEGSLPSYFASGSEKKNIKWLTSGCMTFDEALGGGYALGRVLNIVGDKSSGKTLLAMEACANFARDYPDGWIRYAETEAAFDLDYAEALGIPVDRLIMNKDGVPIHTVEVLYEDMKALLSENKGRPGIYIVDSLDAISDEAEEKRGFDEGTYGGTKPKQIGKMFRMLVEEFHRQNVLLIIISQLRDKIGVTFGETKTRSGGRALDFYATHIVWLAEIGKIKKTINGIERTVGVNVRAKIKKNKVGLAHREADYPIYYGYGIDDLTSGIEWLIAAKQEARLQEIDVTKSGYKTKVALLRNKGGQVVQEFREKLRKIVRQEWGALEQEFLPKAKKY